MKILVLFHMHGCPHCPPLMEACRAQASAPVVMLEAGHPLTSEVGIASFPTLWLSTPEALFEFGGLRSAPAIGQWVTEV